MKKTIYEILKKTSCIFTRDGKEVLRYIEAQSDGTRQVLTKEITPLMRTLTIGNDDGEFIEIVQSKDYIKHKSLPNENKIGIAYSVPRIEFTFSKRQQFIEEDAKDRLIIGICQRCLADCLQPTSYIYYYVQEHEDRITYMAQCFVVKA